MKVKYASLALALAATVSTSAWADVTTTSTPTKSSWGGNQLMSGTVLPITERPASIIGPVDGVAAKKGETLLALKAGSALFLAGDSTLHKYEMGAKSLMGSAVLKGSASSLSTDDGLLAALKAGKVSAMTLTVPVTFLKSKESGLDSNAYKTLNTDQNPNITFTLDSETLAGGKDAGSYLMTAKGSLTISGATQPIALTADTTVKDGVIRLKGVQPLKMTDYKVTPPVFNLVVTSIKCTDDIEIHYDVQFAVAEGAGK
jgi:polyisoprenoid-binding protein YceI